MDDKKKAGAEEAPVHKPEMSDLTAVDYPDLCDELDEVVDLFDCIPREGVK